LVLDEVLVFVFLELFGGFDFERIGPHDLQVGAAFIAAQRITLVDVFFIHVDLAVANGTANHKNSTSPKLTLYETPRRLPTEILRIVNQRPACLASRLRVVTGTRPFSRRYMNNCERWVSSCSLQVCSI